MTLELDSYAAPSGPNDMHTMCGASNTRTKELHEGRPELCHRALSLAQELVRLLEDPKTGDEAGAAASEVSVAASLASHVVEILKSVPGAA